MKRPELRALFAPPILYLVAANLLVDAVYGMSKGIYLWKTMYEQHHHPAFFRFRGFIVIFFLLIAFAGALWSSRLSRCLRLLNLATGIIMFSAVAGFVLPAGYADIWFGGMITGNALFFAAFMSCLARYASRLGAGAVLVFLLYIYLIYYVIPLDKIWIPGDDFNAEQAKIFFVLAFLATSLAAWMTTRLKAEDFETADEGKCLPRREFIWSLLLLLLIWPISSILMGYGQGILSLIKLHISTKLWLFMFWKTFIPLTSGILLLILFYRKPVRVGAAWLALGGMAAIGFFMGLDVITDITEKGKIVLLLTAGGYYIFFMGLISLYYTYFTLRFRADDYALLFLIPAAVLNALMHLQRLLMDKESARYEGRFVSWIVVFEFLVIIGYVIYRMVRNYLCRKSR